MEYFMIYDLENEKFISNAWYAYRKDANKMCNTLESNRGGFFIPVKFINGEQVGVI